MNIAKKKSLRKNKAAKNSVWIENLTYIVLLGATVAIPLIFSPWNADIFAAPKVGLLMTMATALLILLILRPEIIVMKIRSQLRLTTPMMIFFILLILSFLASADKGLSLNGAYNQREGFLTFLAYGVLFLAALTIDWNSKKLERFCRILVDVVTFIAAYGILQFFGFDLIPWPKGGFPMWRSFSTLGNPVFLALLLTTILPIALIFAMSKKRENRREPIIYQLQTVVIFAAIITSFTRGAWLVSIFLIGLIFWWLLHIGNEKRAYIKIVFTVIIASIITLTFFTGHGLGRRLLSILSLRSIQSSSRLDLWLTAERLIKARPLLGWGPDSFSLVAGRYFTPHLAAIRAVANNPHNYFIHLAATLGIPAALAFIVWLLLIIKQAFKVGKRRQGLERLLWPAIGFSLIGFAAVSLIDVAQPSVTFLIWIFSGMIVSASIKAKKKAADNSSVNIYYKGLVIAPLLVLALLFSYFSITLTLADYYALQATISNNYYQAEAYYLKAVKLAPGIPIYHIKLCELRRGKAVYDSKVLSFQQSLDCLHKGESNHPLEAEFYISEAKTLLAAGKMVDNKFYRRADLPIKKLENLMPNSLDGYYLRALLALRLGKKTLATEALGKAFKINTGDKKMPAELKSFLDKKNDRRRKTGDREEHKE